MLLLVPAALKGDAVVQLVRQLAEPRSLTKSEPPRESMHACLQMCLSAMPCSERFTRGQMVALERLGSLREITRACADPATLVRETAAAPDAHYGTLDQQSPGVKHGAEAVTYEQALQLQAFFHTPLSHASSAADNFLQGFF